MESLNTTTVASSVDANQNIRDNGTDKKEHAVLSGTLVQTPDGQTVLLQGVNLNSSHQVVQLVENHSNPLNVAREPDLASNRGIPPAPMVSHQTQVSSVPITNATVAQASSININALSNEQKEQLLRQLLSTQWQQKSQSQNMIISDASTLPRYPNNVSTLVASSGLTLGNTSTMPCASSTQNNHPSSAITTNSPFRLSLNATERTLHDMVFSSPILTTDILLKKVAPGVLLGPQTQTVLNKIDARLSQYASLTALSEEQSTHLHELREYQVKILIAAKEKQDELMRTQTVTKLIEQQARSLREESISQMSKSPKKKPKKRKSVQVTQSTTQSFTTNAVPNAVIGQSTDSVNSLAVNSSSISMQLYPGSDATQSYEAMQTLPMTDTMPAQESTCSLSDQSLFPSAADTVPSQATFSFSESPTKRGRKGGQSTGTPSNSSARRPKLKPPNSDDSMELRHKILGIIFNERMKGTPYTSGCSTPSARVATPSSISSSDGDSSMVTPPNPVGSNQPISGIAFASDGFSNSLPTQVISSATQFPSIPSSNYNPSSSPPIQQNAILAPPNCPTIPGELSPSSSFSLSSSQRSSNDLQLPAFNLGMDACNLASLSTGFKNTEQQASMATPKAAKKRGRQKKKKEEIIPFEQEPSTGSLVMLPNPSVPGVRPQLIAVVQPTVQQSRSTGEIQTQQPAAGLDIASLQAQLIAAAAQARTTNDSTNTNDDQLLMESMRKLGESMESLRRYQNAQIARRQSSVSTVPTTPTSSTMPCVVGQDSLVQSQSDSTGISADSKKNNVITDASTVAGNLALAKASCVPCPTQSLSVVDGNLTTPILLQSASALPNANTGGVWISLQPSAQISGLAVTDNPAQGQWTQIATETIATTCLSQKNSSLNDNLVSSSSSTQHSASSTPSIEPAFKRTTTQLVEAQKRVIKPSCSVPFRSAEDACERLMSYHICQPPTEPLPSLLAQVDAEFQESSSKLIEKYNRLVFRYRKTLWEDSLREPTCSSETVLMQRLFLKEEADSLREDRSNLLEMLRQTNAQLSFTETSQPSVTVESATTTAVREQSQLTATSSRTQQQPVLLNVDNQQQLVYCLSSAASLEQLSVSNNVTNSTGENEVSNSESIPLIQISSKDTHHTCPESNIKNSLQ